MKRKRLKNSRYLSQCLSSRVCPMAIFKNSISESKYTSYVIKRVWTFFHNIDCQNKEDFYLDQTWAYASSKKFASICKSKCQNTATESTTTLTRTTTLSTKTARQLRPKAHHWQKQQLAFEIGIIKNCLKYMHYPSFPNRVMQNALNLHS